jgi:hypothetical protein
VNVELALAEEFPGVLGGVPASGDHRDDVKDDGDERGDVLLKGKGESDQPKDTADCRKDGELLPFIFVVVLLLGGPGDLAPLPKFGRGFAGFLFEDGCFPVVDGVDLFA